MEFTDRLKETRPLLMDGAMGTTLFRLLPGYAGSFESLNIERPEVIAQIHRVYIGTGADIIETNTFGGSRIKLAEYGLGERCGEINERAAAIARNSAGSARILVAGSVGPTGRMIEPIGETPVEEAYEAFAEQVRGLERGGADLIVIETMTDVLEAKLALLAAKDHTRLPVIASMSFQESGVTVTGTDMLTGLAVLSASGADAVGANCSMGPEGLLAIYGRYIGRLRELGVPLTVWANAGLPRIVEGKAVYTLTPEAFAETSAGFARIGIKVIGGCCGTSPEHIAALRKRIDSMEIPPPEGPFRRSWRFAASRFRTLDVGGDAGLLLIGERLNPTARKKFAEDLKAGQNAFLREEARKQEQEGADLLDINVGVPSIDEAAAMKRSVFLLSTIVKVPLMIDSDNPVVMETALRAYPGVAVLNSINGKKKSVEAVLPLLRRFGCFVVALCLDDSGVHREAERRIAIGERLIGLLESEGIDRGRVFIDPLMLAESAEPGSAAETLKVIAHFRAKGIKTSLGISNISFGLPQRKLVNNVYLTLAAAQGLTAAIVNPAAARLLPDFSGEERFALDFLEGNDPGATRYISRFGGRKEESGPPLSPEALAADPVARIYRMVIEGNGDAVGEEVLSALGTLAPDEIMNRALIAALEKVGELYSTGEYFLPQMIASANAMKKGFGVLKPLLTRQASRKLGTVVICTVRGDIHDIGKNIVAMMLENHGFEVHDLGKDVPGETVLEALRRLRPGILCLSSLLTTTMGEMKAISETISREKIPVKLLIGGAVVNREYAESIGAWYGQDAVEGVRIAKEIAGGSPSSS